MEIKKESRKCMIPNKYFFSIPFKEVIGNKLVVIAKDFKEAKKLLEFELEIRGKS